jgi:hypothetical protein
MNKDSSSYVSTSLENSEISFFEIQDGGALGERFKYKIGKRDYRRFEMRFFLFIL